MFLFDRETETLRVVLSDEVIARRVTLANTIVDFDRGDDSRIVGIEVVGVRSFSRHQGREIVWTCKLPPEARYDSHGDGFYFQACPEGSYEGPPISKGEPNVHLCLNDRDEIVALEVEIEPDWHV